ncbi:hypothetical protein IRJ41_010435 [Triplophysa rosa]|uniref:Uncharacterized protein n=1 Tax=Triplophysa rosa TaxID=992332 RepID=A0A9W7T7S4_TRIRA|nr:hypothetical protein IRJ41_010435 [Triplophysa rosa]
MTSVLYRHGIGEVHLQRGSACMQMKQRWSDAGQSYSPQAVPTMQHCSRSESLPAPRYFSIFHEENLHVLSLLVSSWMFAWDISGMPDPGWSIDEGRLSFDYRPDKWIQRSGFSAAPCAVTEVG